MMDYLHLINTCSHFQTYDIFVFNSLEYNVYYFGIDNTANFSHHLKTHFQQGNLNQSSSL